MNLMISDFTLSQSIMLGKLKAWREGHEEYQYLYLDESVEKLHMSMFLEAINE